jgi:ketosteroid isomerase-like protein
MSRENIDAVRSLLTASDPAAGEEFSNPEIEWVIAREHPEARTLAGREAIAAYLQEWQAALPGMTFVADRVLDGREAVVAVGTVRGTGAESGADVEVPIAFLCRLTDGKVVRVEEYLDPKEALELAGIV